jgi:hypothetical protein
MGRAMASPDELAADLRLGELDGRGR